MSKRKHTTITSVPEKGYVNEENAIKQEREFKNLANKLSSEVLEEALTKAAGDESEDILDILLRPNEVLISTLIKLAEEDDLEGILELANAYDLVGSEWILQQTIDKAKKYSMPNSVTDIIYLALELDLSSREDDVDIKEIKVLSSGQD